MKTIILALVTLSAALAFAKTSPVAVATNRASAGTVSYNTTGLGNIRGIQITAVRGYLKLRHVIIDGTQYAQFNEEHCQYPPITLAQGQTCTVSTYTSPSYIEVSTQASRQNRGAMYNVTALVKR